MEVGKYTLGANNITLKWSAFSDLTIGKFCSLAENITIFLGGNHRSDLISTYPFGSVYSATFNEVSGLGVHNYSNGDVIIGNDVWIGANVTIMSGLTIGDGAIIAANSHVVSNVKPYSIVGGNPAKFYYFRFDKETIEKLLEIKWWDLEDDAINMISPLLSSNDFTKLFDMCDKIKTGEIKPVHIHKRLHMSYDCMSNRVHITPGNDMHVHVEIMSGDSHNILYGTDAQFIKDSTLWFQPDRNLYNEGSIIIKIIDLNTKVVHTEFMKFR